MCTSLIYLDSCWVEFIAINLTVICSSSSFWIGVLRVKCVIVFTFMVGNIYLNFYTQVFNQEFDFLEFFEIRLVCDIVLFLFKL